MIIFITHEQRFRCLLEPGTGTESNRTGSRTGNFIKHFGAGILNSKESKNKNLT